MPVRVPPKPAPNAMCAAAFSSSSVWKYGAPALADARGRVDERDLAEPAAVALRVAVDVRGDEVAILLLARVEPDELAVAELAAQPFDQPALKRERERAREPAVRPGRVRARERLLGRHVRARSSRRTASPPGRRASASPARGRRSRSVPGPRSSRPVSPSRVSFAERRASARTWFSQPAEPLPSSSVSRQNQRKSCASLRLPSSGVSVGIDLPGPEVGRPRGTRPARLQVEVRAAVERGALRRAREIDARGASGRCRRDSRARSRP